MKIRYKLPATFLVFSIAMAALFYLAALGSQKAAFRRIAVERLTEIKDSLGHMEAGDIKMMMATLEAVSRDPAIKAAYLEKEKSRDKLFAYVLPLFEGLRERAGITRFCFILPNGRVFLRLPEKKKNLYGDHAEESSVAKARKTGRPAWDIEPGKTTLALSVVTPYFGGGKLIGYLEVAEGINHFLEDLKGRTTDEFALAAAGPKTPDAPFTGGKPEGGPPAPKNMPAPKNKKYALLASTGALDKSCFTEHNIKRVESGHGVLGQLQKDGRTYMCGGFPLDNAGGAHIGILLALTDITGHVALAGRANRKLLAMAAAFFLLAFLAGAVISRFITGPLRKMSRAARALGRGGMDTRVDVNSPDELGELAGAFNEMASKRRQIERHLKMHEEDLEKLARARATQLIASEQRYRTIVEAAREGIIIVDEDERITFANGSMARMLDVEKEDLVGRPVTDFMDDAAAAGFRDRLRRRRAGTTEKPFDFRFRDRGGREVWAIISSSTISGAGGEYKGFVSLITDITERRRLESIAEAANLMENIGYIFSGIRHEIANPVVTASITLDVLKRKLKTLDQAGIEEYIDRTKEQMSRLDFLLKSLRNFNLFESVTMEQASIAAVLEKFLALVTDDAKKRGIKVESMLSPEARTVWADERALAQVLLNIVTNAFDALGGMENPVIKISVLKVDRLILFRVEDNGRGMTPEQVKNLFRPFFTTKPHGTGLGLAIVKKMVSKMQGHVEITSHENEGTVVDIFLPETGPEGPEGGLKGGT